jgi:hypothetical protein
MLSLNCTYSVCHRPPLQLILVFFRARSVATLVLRSQALALAASAFISYCAPAPANNLHFLAGWRARCSMFHVLRPITVLVSLCAPTISSFARIIPPVLLRQELAFRRLNAACLTRWSSLLLAIPFLGLRQCSRLSPSVLLFQLFQALLGALAHKHGANNINAPWELMAVGPSKSTPSCESQRCAPSCTATNDFCSI